MRSHNEGLGLKFNRYEVNVVYYLRNDSQQLNVIRLFKCTSHISKEKNDMFDGGEFLLICLILWLFMVSILKYRKVF